MNTNATTERQKNVTLLLALAERGLKQVQLARMTGRRPETINRAINGSNPSSSTRALIAEVLSRTPVIDTGAAVEITVTDLFGGVS